MQLGHIRPRQSFFALEVEMPRRNRPAVQQGAWRFRDCRDRSLLFSNRTVHELLDRVLRGFHHLLFHGIHHGPQPHHCRWRYRGPGTFLISSLLVKAVLRSLKKLAWGPKSRPLFSQSVTNGDFQTMLQDKYSSVLGLTKTFRLDFQAFLKASGEDMLTFFCWRAVQAWSLLLHLPCERRVHVSYGHSRQFARRFGPRHGSERLLCERLQSHRWGPVTVTCRSSPAVFTSST
jgi:hypothetical protein